MIASPFWRETCGSSRRHVDVATSNTKGELMLRTSLILVAFVTAFSPGWALAQISEADRNVLVGVEGLVGFRFSRFTEKDGDSDSKSSFKGRGPFIGNQISATEFQLLRPPLVLTVDLLTPVGVTLGMSGGASLVQTSSSRTSSGGQTDQSKGDNLTALEIGPRVGFLTPIGDGLEVWGRAGVIWFRSGLSDRDDDDSSTYSGFRGQFALDLVISPFERFAFTFGPFYNPGLTGSRSRDGGPDDDDDYLVTDYGVDAGVVVAF